MEYTIIWNSADTTGQSTLSKAIAKVKYPLATLVDIAGDDSAAIDAHIAAIGAGTQTKIIVAVPVADTHAVGSLTAVQAVACIAMLTTAAQAASSNLTGTAQANSTLTDIILASATSQVDDALNNKLIVTAGVTAVTKLIKDYTEVDDTAVVTTTGTAITTTETYTVYMTEALVLGGVYTGSVDGCRLTWNAMYPNQEGIPHMVTYLENASTLYEKNGKTSTGVGTAYLEDTTEFTAAAYDDGKYYLAITNGSTAGEVRRILSNTVTKLTLESDFDVPLTGTPTYQIVHENHNTLWNQYIGYTIAGWLSNDNVATDEIFGDILDQYDDLAGESSTHRTYFQDLDLLATWLEKGKATVEGIAAGIVS